MKKTKYARRVGFTLVEMLVVIAIIGILAAFLVPTLYIVVRRAKENAIAQEVTQMAMSIQSYKDQNGDIPPDFTDAAVVQRHLRKIAPRHRDAFANTAMKLPNGLDAAGTSGRFDVANLDPSEALVFWLAMVKNDPRLPLNGTSDPVPVFPFDETRLVDLDGDGWLSYVPPDGKDMPYVYFDSRTYATAALNDPVSGTPMLYPYKTSLNETDAATAWKFADETKFQIISGGLDGEYGAVTPNTYKRFPFGDNYEIEDLDNITSFSDNKILEDHME